MDICNGRFEVQTKGSFCTENFFMVFYIVYLVSMFRVLHCKCQLSTSFLYIVMLVFTYVYIINVNLNKEKRKPEKN